MRYTVAAPGPLGVCLARLLGGASNRTRKQMLAAGRIRVNGTAARRADVALVAGDVVEIGARTPDAPLPAGVRIVHEDDDVLVVEKPAGLLTIATDRERARTLYAYLTARARSRRPRGRVFIVHRLDRRASGLVVFATTPESKRALQAQFAAHATERVYLAVVEGRPAEPAGVVRSRLLDDAPGRVRETARLDRGREAVTRWRVVRVRDGHTLVEVHLDTGRRNQIRVHLAGIGHPIAGDAAYGARTDPIGRLALHAAVLGFDHPRTGTRLRFESAAPRAFTSRASRRSP